uniref:Activating transcription factor 7 interacting protein n=1 Tax=Nothobranchius furzeri TaxID=105023 RepID=A0A8C6MBE9_NOTFU
MGGWEGGWVTAVVNSSLDLDCTHLFLCILSVLVFQQGAMEVVVPEEKKKIFRARKTMKMSDRLQLESLHSTLLTTPGSSNPSPPPLMNGTHKEDGQKTSDKEQNNISDSNSPAATSPASPTSLSSPTPFLSLNLSPSPASSESPKPQDEASCPNSPLSPDFPDAKKTEDKEKKSSSSSYPDDSVTPVPNDVEEEEDEKPNKNTESKSEEKMEVDKIQSEFRKETKEDEKYKEGKSSTSGLKRTLSEGDEKDDVTVKMEGKRPKMEHEELEAHLKLKITAKAGSQHKLEKIVQQLVNEQLQILELAIFDKHFKELKDRVDKVECATKHQTAINTLQSKISRLVKKFGEANQASENKKKQEVRCGFSCFNPPDLRVRLASKISVPVSIPASVAAAAPAAVSLPTPTSTTMVPQGSILQLITSNANAASTLATGITTQSQPGTLVLKTTPGSGMVTAGQPLVIQLPLSVNGQTGTLVNFPVSSLSAASSLNKSKTTPSTTTFILKSPPSTNAFSVARTVYQGGASRITTPNAGVSVTTVRAPAQSVSVAGALSSAASPATSGPAATGSTAPGTPQGTSLTSKTAATPVAATAARPKGSVIDLTEDDDDVQGRTEVQDSSLKPRTVTTTTAPRGSSAPLPPLPSAPAPLRLPPEAEQTSPPQQLQLKLVPGQTGIVLSWSVSETDRSCAAVDSYHLYAFHQDNSNSGSAQQHWKKIGEVNALPLPMACTLTQFQSGSTYYFAVRAKDIYGRFGAFCEPQCTNVISSGSS